MRRVLSFVLALTVLFTLAVIPAEASSPVDDYINSMSPKQKITQMLMMDFRQWKSEGEETATDFTVMNDEVRQILTDYDFGAVVCYANNIKTTEGTFALTAAMQDAATQDNGIPMLIATDQEGGIVYRLGSGTALPGNMALGATRNPEYARETGRIIGSELSSLGINVSLAPVVDVNSNANNPVIGLRSYGDDVETVGNMASECIAGMAESGVIGCAKHFPGHGDTAINSNYGLPSVDKPLDVLMNNELAPYKTAIAQGVDMIMAANILYPQLEQDTILSEKTGKNESLPVPMSDDIITGLLKGTLGFEGIVCTDSMKMAGIADYWDEVQAAINAINAGVDLICVPTSVHSKEDLPKLDAVINGVLAAVNNGEIPASRLDDACRRILTVKKNHGILDYDAASFSLAKAKAVVGSAENRAKEHEMAVKAVTVIENKNNALPLKVTENSKVLMLTPYNNELAPLAMGWNRVKQAGLIPAGAQVKVVRYANTGTPYDISDYRAALDWADTVLIDSEVSASSYIANSAWIYAGARSLLEYASQNGKKTVVMSIDLPYDVQLYPEADAVLAVYCSNGSNYDPEEVLRTGMTDSDIACCPNMIAGIEVAFGAFGASGVLPVNIPAFDMASGSYSENLAYARGYGLFYNAVDNTPVDKSELQRTVSEAKKLDRSAYTADTWQALNKALKNAENVLQDADAGEKDVLAALGTLQSAVNALEKVKAEPTSAPENKASPVDEKSPNTGDPFISKFNGIGCSPMALCVIIEVFALAAVIYLFACKKKEN